MNIKDLDPNLLQRLIDQMENLHPGLLQSLNDTEADKRRLCQEEQNLTEDIDDANRELATLTSNMEAEIHKAISKITANIHGNYDPQIDDVKGRIQRLQAKLTAIHQEYISKYPSTPAPNPVKKPDIRNAFKCIYHEFLNHIPDGYGMDKAVTTKLFKRFDNLVHARCHSTELFGYDWTITDVINMLHASDCHTLADDIHSFWKSNAFIH